MSNTTNDAPSVLSKRERKRQIFIERKTILLNKALADLEEYSAKFNSIKDIAIAELVRYCNRYVKSFPKYKQRSKWQRNIVDLVYALKDTWIRLNKVNCIQHCKSAVHTHTYIDWEDFYDQRQGSNEFLDTENFEVTKTATFYAYTFLINETEFKFHSQVVLFEENQFSRVNPDANGSTQPLTSEEKTISIVRACTMLAAALGECVHESDIKSLIQLAAQERRKKEKRRNNAGKKD